MARPTATCLTCTARAEIASYRQDGTARLAQHWQPEGGICPGTTAATTTEETQR